MTILVLRNLLFFCFFLSRTLVAGADECSARQSQLFTPNETSSETMQERIQKRFTFVRDRLKTISSGIRPVPYFKIEQASEDLPYMNTREHDLRAVFWHDSVVVSKSFLYWGRELQIPMLTHEIFHLYVTRNFNVQYRISQVSLDQALKEVFRNVTYDSNGNISRDQITPEVAHVFSELIRHKPYAELLCDVAAVLLTGDPKSIATPMSGAENKFFSPKDPEMHYMNIRDFSYPSDHPSWKRFIPKSWEHDSFNQVRSHLWHNWMRHLSEEQKPIFLKTLVENVANVFEKAPLRGASIEIKEHVDGVELYEQNRKFIEFLDSRLEATLGHKFLEP